MKNRLYTPIMRKISLVLFLISVCYITLQAQQITLDDLFVSRSFQQSTVNGLASTNDGLNYTTLENNGQQIVKYSYKTGEKVSLVLDIKTLKNDSLKSIKEYVFSSDESKVLLLTDRKPIYRRSFTAVYFVYNFVTKELERLSTGRQQVATFSPDGDRIAFVRNNNLFVKSLRFKTERQMTTDGEFNKIINGIPDWVYEEEFEFNRAFEWSPDSKQISYIKFDEEQVPTFGFPMYKGLNPIHEENRVYPGEYRFKYPKAGEKNSIVSVWVYDIKAGQNIKMDIGTETDIYVPKICWTYGGKNLGIVKMNRLQNRLELLFANSYTGDSRLVFTEKNKRYIETDFLDNFQFLPDDKTFVTLSEQDGYKHLYLYDAGGVKIRQLTTGKFDVLKFYGFDPATKMFYYQAAAVSPMQREVYGVSIDLKKKVLLSKQEGTNNADFSTGFKYFINEYSNATTPLVVTLHEISGKQIRVLEDNSELKSKIAERKVPLKEFFTFKTKEGIELNGWMIKPLNFNPTTKYPVLMTQYSGPNSQEVLDNFKIGWDNYLAENGYLVACVDPRGTGARGEDFRKCTYGQLGKYESDDQIEAAKYLAGLPYVDGKNIAMWGWSYGGFMSAMCLAKGGDVFKAGISVAPVTNQRYYDTVYSERYMGLPSQNPEGYDENSPVTLAKGIKGKLLLVHGTADDNVHFQNSLEFAEAMVQAGVQFQMMAYVNRNHGIRGGNTTMHLYTMFDNFLKDNLK
ncbi:MAG TPA: S9 family peptidase [Prolixibacteraceae bacterium]|nr:S9 family peptidase [Prolixibacteraceae bacterium]